MAQIVADVRHARLGVSPTNYQIVVKGELGVRDASAFEAMTICAHDGITEITGEITDPAHLQENGDGCTSHRRTPSRHSPERTVTP